MLNRYLLSEIKYLLSEERKLEYWRDIEAIVIKAKSNLNIIDNGNDLYHELISLPIPTLEEVNKREKETNHDMIAFIDVLGSRGSKRLRSELHLGLTSSDVLDSALSLLIRDINKVLINKVKRLIELLKINAFKYKDQLRVGRTHGVYAEIVSFGLFFANHAYALYRSYNQLVSLKDSLEVIKISGAVGMYSNISPSVEAEVARILNMNVSPISTQVIMRDSIARWISELSIIGEICSSIALEIRNSSRSEVDEIHESFSKLQMGSSAMPHKRNPIISERICGLARIAVSNVIPTIESIQLWHERDISHSSVERFTIPDTVSVIDYILETTYQLVDNLYINKECMNRRVNENIDLLSSSKLLSFMLNSGIERIHAYRFLQSFFKDRKESIEKIKISFKDEMSKKYKINISEEDLSTLFSTKIEHIDELIDRVRKIEI